VTNNQKHDWDTLWVNANLATMARAGSYEIIKNGAVGIKGGKISWVGAMDALPETHTGEVRDAKHAWLTPGLIDCHTHLVYAGNRAEEFALRLQGKSYAEIAKSGGGILSTVRATRAATEEELLALSEKRLRSFLNEGVTTIEIKSGYGLDTASEMKMLRVARKLQELHPVTVRTTFLGAHTMPPEFSDKDAYIDMICNEMLPTITKAKLADAVDGFCESIAFSPAQITKLFDAAKKHGLAIKLHAEQLTDQGGAALASKYNALSADHLEYISEAGVKAMAKSGTVAVLLPGAFYTLRETRKPPVQLFRTHNVAMAIASDSNPGTSPVCSLLLMINMGCVLFGMTPEEALCAVTRNAAKALGIDDTVGTLEVGKVADMALWDIAHPVDLAYNFGYNPCIGVINRGKFRTMKA